jgi:hypothetical protein
MLAKITSNSMVKLYLLVWNQDSRTSVMSFVNVPLTNHVPELRLISLANIVWLLNNGTRMGCLSLFSTIY